MNLNHHNLPKCADQPADPERAKASAQVTAVRRHPGDQAAVLVGFDGILVHVRSSSWARALCWSERVG